MDRIIFGGNLYLNTVNLRLALQKATLPNLTRAKETFMSGGGFFNYAVPYEIEELEMTFSLKGGHEYVRSEFGKEAGDWSTLYWYERLRDIRAQASQRDIGRVVIMRGLISEVAQPTVEGKKAEDTQYKFSSIMEYRDIMNSREIHRMDIENNHLVINGVNYSERHNQLTAS